MPACPASFFRFPTERERFQTDPRQGGDESWNDNVSGLTYELLSKSESDENKC